MNEFNYFSEIEGAFVRLRGKALFVSPTDWTLIESWKETGVPLHVVLRSIEKVFEQHEAKARPRPIQSLSYCKSEVEAQFADYRASRVGASDESVSGEQRAVGSHDGNPFTKDALLAYLARKSDELTQMKDKLDASAPLVLSVRIVVDRVIDQLRERLIGLQFAERIDAQKLEVALSGLEEVLDQAFACITPAETTNEARAAAVARLKPYKIHMEPDVYAKQIELLLKKRLREIYGVPRLSLFYL